jgi:choice-of-anchor B domain-containing protein
VSLAQSGPGGSSIRPKHDGPHEGVGKGGTLEADPTALARLASLTGPAPCVAGRAADLFACDGIELTSFVSLSDLQAGATSGSNLWGFADADDGREYAVIGLNSGTAVVEVTDPTRPRVVGSVPGPASPWREVKVHQRWNAALGRHDAWAYVVSEATGAGLQIIDLTELPESISLLETFRGFETAHTVFLANADPTTGAPNVVDRPPVLYIEGSNEGFLALDLANPRSPSIAGRFVGSYVHDVWAGVLRGNRASACVRHDPCELVVDWGADAVRFIDFTEKSSPVIVSELGYPGLGYAHSGWISRDGDYLFSFDEGDELASGGNSSIRVLDIRNLAQPTVAAVWTSSTAAIEHNGYVVGDLLFVSHYERGLTVLDVSAPTTPREIGFFDTFPASDTARFHGAWGVYPFLPSGTLLVSNIDGAGGLFVLRMEAPSIAPPPDAPRGPVVPVPPRSRETRRVPVSR